MQQRTAKTTTKFGSQWQPTTAAATTNTATPVAVSPPRFKTKVSSTTAAAPAAADNSDGPVQKVKLKSVAAPATKPKSFVKSSNVGSSSSTSNDKVSKYTGNSKTSDSETPATPSTPSPAPSSVRSQRETFRTPSVRSKVIKNVAGDSVDSGEPSQSVQLKSTKSLTNTAKTPVKSSSDAIGGTGSPFGKVALKSATKETTGTLKPVTRSSLQNSNNDSVHEKDKSSKVNTPDKVGSIPKKTEVPVRKFGQAAESSNETKTTEKNSSNAFKSGNTFKENKAEQPTKLKSTVPSASKFTASVKSNDSNNSGQGNFHGKVAPKPTENKATSALKHESKPSTLAPVSSNQKDKVFKDSSKEPVQPNLKRVVGIKVTQPASSDHERSNTFQKDGPAKLNAKGLNSATGVGSSPFLKSSTSTTSNVNTPVKNSFSSSNGGSSPYEKVALKATGNKSTEPSPKVTHGLKGAEPPAYDQDRLKVSRQGGVLRTKSFDDEFGTGQKPHQEGPRRRPHQDEAAQPIANTPESALLSAALSNVSDKSLEKQISGYISRIKEAGGFPAQRRLSVRDNDLIANMAKVITNDPNTTEFVIDGDERFGHIKAAYLVEFAEGIRTNFYLKKLKITNVDLDNTFLSALSTSLESNIILEEIILTDNSFTNDALVEFCAAMEANTTLLRVDLRRQRSPVLTTSEEQVLESLKNNTTLNDLKIEFKSKEAASQLQAILKRSKQKSSTNKNKNQLVVNLLKCEAERAEQLREQRQLELDYKEAGADDWDYLYELSELAQKYRLTHVVMTEEDDTQPVDDESDPAKISVKYTDDGAFLTDEFISTYLKEEKDGTLTFAFQTQAKMFKRFPVGDSRRKFISEKFADVLLDHPRQKEITAVNMANCACGNEWLVQFCKRCLADAKLLPKLHMLNMETNFVAQEGMIALADCIASRPTWPYLQVVRLENQRHLISSKAELALAKALCVNRSVIRFSLRVRNLWERDQINKYISRNLDYTRQARVKHAIATGTYVERPRNDMEEFFDKIAANDATIKEVDLVGNQLFLALPSEEVVKAGESFATNHHVKELKMTLLKLDDDFACALAKSLETNYTLEKISLDSNLIAGKGIKALVSSLAKNTSVQDLQIRHQGKVMATSEEEELCELLEPNNTLCRLGIDHRSQRAQSELSRKVTTNSENRRKINHELSGAANQKPKGKMQVFFDQIANNDPSITEVELVSDQVFLALKDADRREAAASFANNTFVREVKMTGLQLDDAFGKELGKAIASSKITKLNLESNAIGSEGIRAIIEGLGKNHTITDCTLRHQTKPLASTDEDALAGLLANNETVIKLGLDLRSILAKRDIDKKVADNRDLVRTRRVERSRSCDL